ncbi:MAG TPA: adenosine deaminase [Candidatus Krumholzibacteria bacterium]|nr:adenosine deaminase [Candidatus Krumholzibacteria bacterium]
MRLGDYRPSDLLRGAAIPDEVLAALPKTDLHVHLDGSLRLETFIELGPAAGLDVSGTAAEVRARHFPAERETCQHEFLEHFRHTTAVLQTAGNLERVAYELAEDFAAEGVWYAEVRFCPLFHTAGGLSPDDAIAAVKRGLDAAGAARGIRTGIIITGIRTIEPAKSLELARLAVEWKGRGVVAFDLAGEEQDNPPKRHREAFYHCLNNNQNVTIHAGEGYGPASIHQALHVCGANRIGLGTRLEEDPDLMAYVADNRIPLEVCLGSNLQSGVVADLGDHPFRQYLKKGLRVSLNTDNTLFARTSPLRELRRAVDTFDLTLLETEHVLINGFKSAFLPELDKRRMTVEAIATFGSLRDKHGLDDLAGAGL